MIDKKAVIKEVLEWIYCIIIAVALALLIRYFIGTPTVVKQTSMFPTLKQDQRLILNRLYKTFNEEPKRGDIITFEAPSKSAVNGVKAIYEYEPQNIFEKFSYYVLEVNKISYIKRIVALPGEHVVIKDGKVYINDQELQEDYLQPNVITEPQNSYLEDFVVPDGYVFAIGDNRTQSSDCRLFGCIPIEKIEAKVCFRFWPFDVFGTVE